MFLKLVRVRTNSEIRCHLILVVYVVGRVVRGSRFQGSLATGMAEITRKFPRPPETRENPGLNRPFALGPVQLNQYLSRQWSGALAGQRLLCCLVQLPLPSTSRMADQSYRSPSFQGRPHLWIRRAAPSIDHFRKGEVITFLCAVYGNGAIF
jgi:hypothetical protein